MQRLILAEKRVATNQCCAVFPWTEFCNSIGQKADIRVLAIAAATILVVLLLDYPWWRVLA